MNDLEGMRANSECRRLRGQRESGSGNQQAVNQCDERIMFTGQLNRTDLSGFANQILGRGNVAPGDDSEAAFALLYTEALGLASLSPADIALGERQFNDQDNELEWPGSSMGRWISQNRTPQVEPVPDNPSTIADANSQPETSATVLHKSELAAWMDAHALTRSSQHCAMYCRLGLEAAGLSTQDRPRSGNAGDYGPFLLRHGAQVVAKDSYVPQVGDTVVFDKTAQHRYGHIEMYDGQRWVSDFMQHSFSPYRDAASTPPFTIYRLT
jgi:hypothetical protein